MTEDPSPAGGTPQCPECGKPVMARAALLDHLEFSHTIEDPDAYLRALEQPAPSSRDWSAILRPVAVGVAAVAVVIGAGVAFASSGSGGGDDVAAGDPDQATVTSAAPVDPTASAPETTTTTTTAPPTTTTAAPTTTSTNAAPTTTTTTADGGDLSAAAFRRPFLRDAEVLDCEPSGAGAVYTLRFVLSGARDVVVDGVAYPDDSADGPHVIELDVSRRSATYADHIDVFDADGTAHPVAINPPAYLAGC